MQENVMAKNSITADLLKEAINLIRGAVMICYPQGLPKWDLVQQAITGTASCIILILFYFHVVNIVHKNYSLSLVCTLTMFLILCFYVHYHQLRKLWIQTLHTYGGQVKSWCVISAWKITPERMTRPRLPPWPTFYSHPCGRFGSFDNDLYTYYWKAVIFKLTSLNYPEHAGEGYDLSVFVVQGENQEKKLISVQFLCCGWYMTDRCKAAGARSELSRTRTGKHLLGSQIYMYMAIPFFLELQWKSVFCGPSNVRLCYNVSANRCRYAQGHDGTLFQGARTPQGSLWDNPLPNLWTFSIIPLALLGIALLLLGFKAICIVVLMAANGRGWGRCLHERRMG